MDSSAVIDLCRNALLSALIIASPMLLAGMAVGLIVGLIQALTQVQDQTVSFVPKLIAMAVVLVVCLSWLIGRMVEFTETVFLSAGLP